MKKKERTRWSWGKILYGLRKYYCMHFCLLQKNCSASNLSDKVSFLQNFLLFGTVTDIFYYLEEYCLIMCRNNWFLFRKLEKSIVHFKSRRSIPSPRREGIDKCSSLLFTYIFLRHWMWPDFLTRIL